MNKRENTRKVKIGDLILGGNNHVYIQSMTNTKTKDIVSTTSQILELEKAGCEIVRVAILDMEDAMAVKKIKEQIHIPLVCDIHFNYELALASIQNGCDKIRLNPGNIQDEDKIKLVIDACKKKNIPIRIGVNTGSLPKGMEVNKENLILAAKKHIDILEKHNFHDIVISLKASNTQLAVESYLLASKTFDYPLHLGITEAGTFFSGTIKSSIGLGILLNEKIGNTIRVSLTDDPIQEVRVAKEILKSFNLIDNVPNLISCPTCGRIQYDMIPIAKEIEKYLETINKKINVAIMGCAVNGPGEAKSADIGVAGGINEAILFKHGKIIRKIKQENIIEELKKEIDLL